ncbi:type II secretion system GspH family protein [Colwellia sp. D2M02]|uniref:type II secretion system protein n=1 Tax=Colwellia sp. D2M02 TaxID=2841562 RepID=UPI001C083B4A|nr:type II secretion system protein [Colwellia sp. D2M02]MBU2891946.1 type II secretion system GspH family protein [Colwellia sp. D2M02]
MMSLSKSKITTRLSGFSLIELMVVMAIISILMGMTGGLVTKTVAQQERQVELEKVKHLFKQLSYRAFYEGLPFQVTLQENKIQITQNEQQQVISFKQLVFVPQDYSISTKAVITPTTFGIFWQEAPRHFAVGSVFEPYEFNDNEE